MKHFHFSLGLMIGMVLSVILNLACVDTKTVTVKKEIPTQPQVEQMKAEKINIAPATVEPAIFLPKMNVFYIGVDNPVVVNMPGVDEKNVKVSCAGCNIKGGYKNKYNVTVTKPGEVKITINAPGVETTTFTYRAKRIPNPIVKLGNKTGGSIGVGEFKAQRGLIAILENFDFDARCQVQGFELTYLQKDESKESLINRGPRYTKETSDLIEKAKPGDTYAFTRVKGKCPGDAAGRILNSLVFMVK